MSLSPRNSSPSLSPSTPSRPHQPWTSSVSVSNGSATASPGGPDERCMNIRSKYNNRRSQADVEYMMSVDDAVGVLLDELTMEKFDSISDQIIAWANISEKERDSMTLILVIRRVYERAIRRATQSEMYARLCWKMKENISPGVQDDEIRDSEGRPVAGGNLFRRYLLNRCQEDFERGWVVKEIMTATAVTKASDDQAVEVANERKIVLDFAAQRARRKGFGLIKFIGELFKFQMLTERTMHECIKKLLGNVDKTESLCWLLKNVGQLLDVPKASKHMDAYFARMNRLRENPDVNPRVQLMLQDLIQLRDRRWVVRSVVIKPTTVSTARGAGTRRAKKFQHIAMSKGSDGTGVSVSLPQSKAGDVSQSGIVSKSPPMAMGSSSASAKKDSKRDSLSQASRNPNTFPMQSQNDEQAI